MGSVYVSLMWTGYNSEQYGHVLPGGTNVVHAIGLYDSNNDEVGHVDGIYIYDDNNHKTLSIRPLNEQEYGTFELDDEQYALSTGNYTLKVNYTSDITSHDFDIPIQAM